MIDWVADHRKHHAFTDEEGDPHSPHAGHGAGLRGMARPVARAHRLAVRDPRAGLLETLRARPDRGRDDAADQPLVPADRAGQPADPLLLHHITWSINSICHFFGKRRFETDDESTNVFWLALPSLGEAWHHNHHAFPRSAFHGLRWYELDPSGWLILALARVGLAWDVVRVTPERARSKLAGADGPDRGPADRQRSPWTRYLAM